jgi:ketosteroid isomerase-like protein
MARWLVAWAVVLSGACSRPLQVGQPQAGGVLAPLSDAQWLWVQSECLDGAMPLAERAGFARNLWTEVHGESLRFVYDTTLAKPSCSSTEVWTLTPAAGGEWRMLPDAVIVQPVGARCGPDVAAERGVLRMASDTLEEVRFRSSFCRGFDVRHVYRRVRVEPLDAQALARRLAAQFSRRDPEAVAALFVDDGVLSESFTRSDTGAPVAHRGREAIRAYLASAFATTPWLSVELTEVEPLTDTGTPGRVVVSVRYMDARLVEPMQARWLLVLVGPQIYSAELQLLSDPKPR